MITEQIPADKPDTNPNPNLITEVPDFSDPAVAARYGTGVRRIGDAFTVEPLPRYYVQSPLSPDQAGEFAIDADMQIRQLVKQMSGDILYGPREHDSEVVARMYGVARTIGDPELSLADRSEVSHGSGVMSLLDAARYYARPAAFSAGGEFVPSNNAHEVVAVGTHAIEAKRLTTSLDYIRKQSHSLSAEMRGQGIDMDVNTAVAIVGLEVAAHESGHALLAGVGDFIMQHSRPHMQHPVATKAYLIHNPEHAVTGNYNTDVAIHEERFAEGYAQLVVGRTLQALGYDEAQIAVVLDAVRPTILIDIADGEHQLDHLQQVDADTSIADVLLQQGIEQDLLDRTHQGYLGNIGYALPLTTNEMVEQLRHLNDEIKGRSLPESELPNAMWSERVKAADRAAVEDKVTRIKQQREQILQERLKQDERATKKTRVARGIKRLLRRQ